MRFPKLQLIAVLAAALALTSCGVRNKTFDSSARVSRGRVVMPDTPQIVNAFEAGNEAVKGFRTRRAFALAGAVHGGTSSTTVAPDPTAVAAAAPASSSWDWDCVATAETGGDWSMHGSRYSSALGILNEAIRENASEEVAARILSGTASRDEQIAVGDALVRRFGVGAWARSTVEKCI